MSAHRKNKAWQAMVHGHVVNGEENVGEGKWVRKDGAYHDGLRARAAANKVRNRKNHEKRKIKPLLGVAGTVKGTAKVVAPTTDKGGAA